MPCVGENPRMYRETPDEEEAILLEIGFSEFLVDCIIGVYPEERLQTQPILIDVRVSYNARDAVVSDQEEYALDYTLLAKQVQTIATEGKFGLLETLAYRIAEGLMDSHNRIIEISVEIRKPRGLPGSRGSVVGYRKSRKPDLPLI